MVKTIKTLTLPTGQTMEICQGDITTLAVGAIVNAANSRLAHGGGVAAAISRKGGQIIQQESNAWVREHGPVTHGHPAYTSAGQLPCKFVIHAVGPVWGEGDEENKLHAAIRSSLALADELELTSIAFPAISTGIFGFPKKLAAIIFMRAIPGYFAKQPDGSSLNSVKIVLYDNTSLEIFLQAFNKAFQPNESQD